MIVIIEDIFFKLTVKAKGNKISTYINDVLIDEMTDNTYGSGSIAFRQAETVDNDEFAAFKNIEINDFNNKPLFKENFSDGTKNWVNISENTVSVINNTMYIHSNQFVRCKIGNEWTDYIATVEISIKNSAAGFCFRVQDEGNCYMWQIYNNQETLRMRRHKKVNGLWYLIGEAVTINPNGY